MSSILNTAKATGLAVCVVGLAACGSGRNTSSESSSSSVSSTSSSSVASVSSVSSQSSVSSTGSESVSCSDALFCDNFEDNAIGGQPQGWNTSGRVSVSNERFYSGSRSIKVESNGYSYNRNFFSKNLADLASAQKQLYGRMMVYLSSANELGGDFTFVQAEGSPKAVSGAPSNTNVMYRARIDGRFDHMMANYDTNNGWSTDCWAHPEFNENTGTPPANEYIVPKDQWACVEWHFDAEADELMYWLNGEELSAIHVNQVGDGCVGQSQQNIWYAPQQFDTLHLGVEQYHNTSRPRTLFIDDVQLDNRYIGCPDSPPQVISSSSSSSASSVALQTAQQLYGEMCVGCHGTNFGRSIRQSYVAGNSVETIAKKINDTMPFGGQSPQDCVGECATAIAEYLKTWL